MLRIAIAILVGVGAHYGLLQLGPSYTVQHYALCVAGAVAVLARLK